MRNYIKLNIQSNMTDDEIRALATQNPMNGEYAFEICRACGGFRSRPDGNSKTAKIVDTCSLCFTT